uniref:NAD(P)-dependent alcohol dehydrogenase n=1 Tax=Vaginimicrobium propionicum TaxID=1871034 RepID=UPI000971001A|nr:NAD(P)-dependent alcohol dehydrogenase [Vaginimicrobium propionicum]
MTDKSGSMRASVLVRQGEIALEQRPIPTPSGDEVLVKMISVGLCGSDVHYYANGRIGDFIVNAPMILGHEASGEIVAVGPDADPKRIGERVSIEPQKCCRVCDYCKTGHYNLCPEMEFYATPPIDGAFCEYAIIQSDFAHPIPDEISWDAAALMEPLSVAIAAARKANLKFGDTVFISGAGPIGCCIAQVAKALGASQIVIVDPVAERRELVLSLGATLACAPGDEVLEGKKFDAFFDATGVTAAVRDGIFRTAPNGTAVLVGLGDDDISLPVAFITSREIKVTGIFRYSNTWPDAIEMVASGKVDLDTLVTDHYGLADVDKMLETKHAPTTMKIVVHPQR